MKYRTIKMNEEQIADFQYAAEVLYGEFGDEERFKEQLGLLGIKYDRHYWDGK